MSLGKKALTVTPILVGIVLVIVGLDWILLGSAVEKTLSIWAIIIGTAITSVFIWPVSEARKRRKYTPVPPMPGYYGQTFGSPEPLIDEADKERK